ncbi:hypothetical protein [Zobellella sp. DQSA1]|uniref:hypothetical protein n=1 Tax=Zobellella sp. DQSA1 TaxID=3342386 RepID=UPI0035C0962C
MQRHSAWLALLLVLVVTCLCLNQRIGQAAPAAMAADIASSAPGEGHCQHSGQLLGKAWNQIEPVLLGLLFVLSLWFWLPPPVDTFSRPSCSPPGPRRRRHLLLCVFRE